MKENEIDLIEKYLTDEMSVREQIEFEELLRNDPKLMQEFILRKEIDNAVIEEDIIDLRDNLVSITKREASFFVKIKKPLLYSSFAALVGLLIIIAGIRT